jgi:NitT/TauT family transport system substrate-binding protein
VQFDDAGLAAKAMFSGKVDAAITWEPFLSQAVKSGVGILLKTTKDYPEINPSGFMVSEQTLINRPDDIKKLLVGLVKATTFSLADTDKSSEIMGKNFNLPKAEVIENRKGLQIASPAVNEQYICAKLPKFSIVFNQASKFWKEEKLTDKILPDGSNYISTIGCKYFKLNTNERL